MAASIAAFLPASLSPCTRTFDQEKSMNLFLVACQSQAAQNEHAALRITWYELSLD
jgi:hypothetical protein